MKTGTLPAPETGTLCVNGAPSASEPPTVAAPEAATDTVQKPSPSGYATPVLSPPGIITLNLPMYGAEGFDTALNTARSAVRSASHAPLPTVPVSTCAPARSSAIVTVSGVVPRRVIL